MVRKSLSAITGEILGISFHNKNLWKARGDVNPRYGGILAVFPQHCQTPLQRNKNEQQQANGDFGPPRTERAVKVDIGLDQPLNCHAKQRAQYRSHPAGKQRTADDHRSDGVQLHPDASHA